MTLSVTWPTPGGDNGVWGGELITGLNTMIAAINAITGGVLTPTLVKTVNYTAAVNDLVRVDASAATRTITLPTAPADGSKIGVHMVAQVAPNNVVIACGGSDVLDVAAGPTSDTLDTLNQSVVYQYHASDSIWITNAASIDFDAFADVAFSGNAGDLDAGILNIERASAGTMKMIIWDTTSSTWQFNGVTVASRPTSRTDIHFIFYGNTSAPSWGINGVDGWNGA